jgi:hypothetical protein
MATPVDIIERFESLDIETLVTIAIEDTAAQFGKLNTDQMYAGRLSTGQEITPPYAASTVAIKRRKGQPTDRVTLRDTHRFHDAYRLQVIGPDLVEDSDVSYATYLEQKYSDKIWGLDDENHEIYVNEDMGPVLKQLISNETGLMTR